MRDESELKALMVVAPLSIEHSRDAAPDRLGPIVAEYKQAPAIPNLLIRSLAGIGALPCFQFWMQSTPSNPASAGGHWILLAAISSASLLSAIILWILRSLQKDDRYIVFKQGIGKVSMGQLTVLRWDQISCLFRGECVKDNKEPDKTHPFLRLQNATGTVLRIGDPRAFVNRTHPDQLAQLVELVESHVQHHLYPELLSRFNRGETLDFGPFTANRAGIAIQRRIIPWHSVASLSKVRPLSFHGEATLGCDETSLEILESGKAFPTARFPLSSVQNAPLLQFIHIALRAP